VYHILIISTNPGLTVASSAPRKNLFVAMPPNETHAGVVMSITPHTIVAMERNLPIGRRWSRYPEGNWEIR
jgi:hypothetical protein